MNFERWYIQIHHSYFIFPSLPGVVWADIQNKEKLIAEIAIAKF
jgi:hypothetical protein